MRKILMLLALLLVWTLVPISVTAQAEATTFTMVGYDFGSEEVALFAGTRLFTLFTNFQDSTGWGGSVYTRLLMAHEQQTDPVNVDGGGGILLLEATYQSFAANIGGGKFSFPRDGDNSEWNWWQVEFGFRPSPKLGVALGLVYLSKPPITTETVILSEFVESESAIEFESIKIGEVDPEDGFLIYFGIAIKP